jgi:hypothetical protein
MKADDTIASTQLKGMEEMPVDLPPSVPVIQIERAAISHKTSQALVAISSSAEKTRQKNDFSADSMPLIDLKSKSLTQEDRQALLSAYKSISLDKINQAKMPDSYVGSRIKAAIAFRQAKSQGDRLSVEEAQNVRCKLVAVAVDKRAGLYVEGGEKAALDFRMSIPPQVLRECQAKASRISSSTVSYSSQTKPKDLSRPTSSLANPQPAKLTISAPAPEKIRVAMEATRRIHVAPEKAERIKVQPEMAKRIHVSSIER